MRQVGLVVVCLVPALLAGRVAGAATAPEPRSPNDSGPSWSSDARFVGFDREEPGDHTRVVHYAPAGHGSDRWVITGHVRGWQPGGRLLLVESGEVTWIYEAGRYVVGSIAGVAATWSPDGGRIAFRRAGVLYVRGTPGAAERRIADWRSPPSWDETGPVWAPDGEEIVFSDGFSLLVAAADGSGVRTLFTGMNQSVNPSWSPDGQRIAFERNVDPHWAIWLVDSSGADLRQLTDSNADSRFPQWGPSRERLAFISDREGVRGEASRYRYALYAQIVGGEPATKLLDDVRPDSPARWSPTGVQIAAAAGQECLRFGIYVARTDVKRVRRITNGCHIDGTPRNDALHGRPHYDIIRSLGGDDTIYARDRVRDVVDCGSGRDTAYVDRIDAVRHCERVHRS